MVGWILNYSLISIAISNSDLNDFILFPSILKASFGSPFRLKFISEIEISSEEVKKTVSNKNVNDFPVPDTQIKV